MAQCRKWNASRPAATIGLMIVPLIDVIFLLLLFFVMTTSFEMAARIRIQLPKPELSRAQTEDLLKDIVIHCEYGDEPSADGARARYRFGTDPPENIETISSRLQSAFANQTDSRIIIRADRRLPFWEVRKVMEVVAANNISLMQVSILRTPEA